MDEYMERCSLCGAKFLNFPELMLSEFCEDCGALIFDEFKKRHLNILGEDEDKYLDEIVDFLRKRLKKQRK